jgi:alpha-tubulin suppressor-like RCC1 family protein
MKQLCGVLLIALSTSESPIANRPADAPHFASVTAGADHACALTDRGDAYCWGSNEFGQLGNGLSDRALHLVPVRVRTDVRFTIVAAGFNHTCAVDRDASAWCWGANDTAQLGDGTTRSAPAPTTIPTRVKTDVKFKTIGPGGGHTCGVSVGGVGYCWGGNWHGQLGVGNRDGDAAAPCCYRVPTAIRTDVKFQSAVAGGISSCAVATDGRAFCWGSPQEGRLGTGAADAANKSLDKTTPTAVSGDTTFTAVVARAWHSCGLSTAHVAFCWGGNILEAGPSVPTRLMTDQRFTAITVGHYHDCGIATDGIAYCWGTNSDGELGNGTTNDSTAPERVAIARRFISIAAGGNVFVSKPGEVSTWGFTCGVTRGDGLVLCWGDNRHGALGNGSTTRALAPTPIASWRRFATSR